MAVRHIKEYYEKMADQYMEMQDNLKEIEKDLANGLVEPEFLERLQEQIKPIKDNYLTLSYIMFLLNQPNRDSKVRKYEQQNKKLLSSIPFENTKEGKISQNNETIKNLKNIMNTTKKNIQVVIFQTIQITTKLT